MSISLAFSGGKLCCNKKTGKNTVSCKFNHATVGADKDVTGELDGEATNGNKTSHKCSSCVKSYAKKPWWKFWAKKSTSNCPCSQAASAKAAAG